MGATVEESGNPFILRPFGVASFNKGFARSLKAPSDTTPKGVYPAWLRYEVKVSDMLSLKASSLTGTTTMIVSGAITLG